MKDLKQEENKYCGECKFFMHETIEGEGLCVVHTKPFVKDCGDRACVWFKDRNEKAV